MAGRRRRTVLAVLAVIASAQTAAQDAPSEPKEPSPTAPAAADVPLFRTLPYTVMLDPLPDAEMDRVLRATSTLVTLAGEPPSGPLGLVRRALADRDRLYAAMGALGYYGALIEITVDGKPADDPDLPTLLASRTSDRPVSVSIKVTPGSLFTFAKVAIVPAAGAPPLPIPFDPASLGIGPGQPARAERVVTAEGGIVSQLKDRGYAFAAVPSRDAVVDHAAGVMDLTEYVSSGPKVGFGLVAVSGQEKMDPDFIASWARFNQGDTYSPASLDRLRKDLTDLGVFSSVRISTGDTPDAAGNVPVFIEVQERPRRFVGFAAQYYSSQGAGVTAYWGHRNLFGEAEKLRIDLGVSGIAENDIVDPNYLAEINFQKPGFLLRDMSLIADLKFERDVLDAYTTSNATATLALDYEWSDELSVFGGVAYSVGSTEQLDTIYDYSLVSFPFGGDLDTTDNLLDPSRGFRLDLTVTPYPGLVGSSLDMLKMEIGGSTYLDVLGDRSLILAGRVTLGSIVGPSLDAIPPDLRLYAGGGGSVRGYAYQTIGPEVEDTPIGGRSSITGSIEARYKITDDIGIVPFFDAGGVYESSYPDFAEEFQYAAGLGGRYYTSLGPLRVDIAFPLNPRPNDEFLQFYVSLGQAF
jgi:translocation and assembly module TamA